MSIVCSYQTYFKSQNDTEIAIKNFIVLITDTTASQSYELDHTTQNTNPVIQWNDEKDVQKG